MKKTALFIVVLLSTSIALAEEISVSAKESSERHEFTLAPAVGYSPSRGVGFGGTAGFGLLLSAHWQVTAEIGFVRSVVRSWGSLETRLGAQYNFSADTAKSPYLGVGVFSAREVSESSYEGLFIRSGYRVQIGSEPKISWSPWVGLFASDRTSVIAIMPLNFSFLF